MYTSSARMLLPGVMIKHELLVCSNFSYATANHEGKTGIKQSRALLGNFSFIAVRPACMKCRRYLDISVEGRCVCVCVCVIFHISGKQIHFLLFFTGTSSFSKRVNYVQITFGQSGFSSR